VPAIYQPRSPRASPLWQIVHHGWDAFLAHYEKFHRKTLGPLDHDAVATVQSFLRCGDLASGFTRLQCPDCGHERLLAFTCKGRHFCPACHQRRTRTIGDWIATGVCHEVPHRQFVFTIPKVLRGIFRKRRHLLTHLFHTATILRFRAGSFEWQAIEKLTEAKNALRSLLDLRSLGEEGGEEGPRTRLNLPEGKLAAIAGVHTFGDYLIFHPHLHILAADGLFDSQGRFHCMRAEDLAPAIELFRHRFLHALRDAKLISPKKLADFLSWKHSGFHIDNGGEKPVPAHDTAGRKRCDWSILLQSVQGASRSVNPTAKPQSFSEN
jgi:hypothetical protein